MQSQCAPLEDKASKVAAVYCRENVRQAGGGVVSLLLVILKTSLGANCKSLKARVRLLAEKMIGFLDITDERVLPPVTHEPDTLYHRLLLMVAPLNVDIHGLGTECT